jgi:hypothetical protein
MTKKELITAIKEIEEGLNSSTTTENFKPALRKEKEKFEKELKEIEEKESKASAPKTEAKPKAEPKKLNYKGKKVEIRPASKTSSKFIVWDVNSNQVFANEKFDSIKDANSFIDENEMVLVKTDDTKPKAAAPKSEPKAKKIRQGLISRLSGDIEKTQTTKS